MSNIEYLAFADTKCTITLWDRKNFELMRVIETEDELDLGNFVFLNNFRGLALVSNNGELYLWNMIYKLHSQTKGKKSGVNALYDEKPVEITDVESNLKLLFEPNENKKNNFKVFSTNFRGDYLVFASDGYRLKVLNSRNGDLLTEIDGAHYKGISSVFFIVNSSTEGQIYRVLNFIENEILHDEPDSETLAVYFQVLLNCLKLITISNKEYIRLWKFQDFKAKLLHQSTHPGGSLAGKSVFHYSNKAKNNFLLTSGKNSNKVIIYQLEEFQH